MSETDTDLPKTLIKRIVKRHLSQVDKSDAKRDTQINKDALLAFSEAAKVFINYITATANDICKENKRQTISIDDIFRALEDTDFLELLVPLKQSLEVFKKDTKEKNQKKAEAKKRKAEQQQVESEQQGDAEQQQDQASAMDVEPAQDMQAPAQSVFGADGQQSVQPQPDHPSQMQAHYGNQSAAAEQLMLAPQLMQVHAEGLVPQNAQAHNNVAGNSLPPDSSSAANIDQQASMQMH